MNYIMQFQVDIFPEKNFHHLFFPPHVSPEDTNLVFAKALLELALNKSDQGLRIEGSGRTGLEAAIAWQPSVAKTEYLPSVVGCWQLL